MSADRYDARNPQRFIHAAVRLHSKKPEHRRKIQKNIVNLSGLNSPPLAVKYVKLFLNSDTPLLAAGRVHFVVDLKSQNMFNTIEIDRAKLTIMGVKFLDLKTLERTANALGSNMFEGFNPTPKGIEIIRDYVAGKISMSELVILAKEKAYV